MSTVSKPFALTLDEVREFVVPFLNKEERQAIMQSIIGQPFSLVLLTFRFVGNGAGGSFTFDGTNSMPPNLFRTLLPRGTVSPQYYDRRDWMQVLGCRKACPATAPTGNTVTPLRRA